MNLKKAISIFTAASFIFTLCGQAFAASPQSASDVGVEKVNIERIVLFSDKFGTVTQVQNYGSPQVIVNIQDLHSHPQVQKNIAAIIEKLDSKYSIKEVYLEGGSGKINVSWLKNLYDINKGLIEQMLENGTLSGTEYFSVLNGKDNIFGLENKEIHRKNIERLGNIYENEAKYAQKLGKIENEISYLFNKFTGSDNKKFAALTAKYRSGKIDTAKYYAHMLSAAEEINSNPAGYGNVFTINAADFSEIRKIDAIEKLSKKLNIKKVNAELSAYLSQLKEKTDFSEYKTILENTDRFQDIGMAAKYISAYGVDGKKMPQLEAFVYLNELNTNVNPVDLYEQEQSLREKITSAFSVNKQESEISFLKDFYHYFENYFTNSLTAADQEYFSEKFNVFARIYGKYAAVDHIKEMEKEISFFDSYYSANNKRNEIFIKNIEKNSKLVSGKENSSKSASETLDKASEVIVVVTGGYHSRGINEILDGKKISRVTITPRVSGGIENALVNYRQIIVEQSRFFKEALAFAIASQMPALGQFTIIMRTANELLKKAEFSEENINILRQELEKITGEKIETAGIGTDNILMKFSSGYEMSVYNYNDAMQINPMPASADLSLRASDFIETFAGKAFNLSSLANILNEDTYEFWKKIFYAATFNGKISYSDGFYPAVENLMSARGYDKYSEIDGFPVEQLARTPEAFQMAVIRKQIEADADPAVKAAQKRSSEGFEKFKKIATKTIMGVLLGVSLLSLAACGDTSKVEEPVVPVYTIETRQEQEPSDVLSIQKAEIVDRKLVVTNQNGQRVQYIGKGIAWGPDIQGETFYDNYVQDISLMQSLGVNCVRTYRPVGEFNGINMDVDKTKEMLDAFQRAGIQLVIGFSERDMRNTVMKQYLAEFGNHPAILMYMFGNEQNMYYDLFEYPDEMEWHKIVREALPVARERTDRPIGVVLGDYYNLKDEAKWYEAMGLDVILLNAYRDGSTVEIENEVLEVTERVLVGIGETGLGSVGPKEEDWSQKQAEIIGEVIDEIQSSSKFGFVFMLRDDPYKRGAWDAGKESSFGVISNNPVERKPAAGVVEEKYSEIPDSIPLDNSGLSVSLPKSPTSSPSLSAIARNIIVSIMTFFIMLSSAACSSEAAVSEQSVLPDEKSSYSRQETVPYADPFTGVLEEKASSPVVRLQSAVGTIDTYIKSSRGNKGILKYVDTDNLIDAYSWVATPLPSLASSSWGIFNYAVNAGASVNPFDISRPKTLPSGIDNAYIRGVADEFLRGNPLPSSFYGDTSIITDPAQKLIAEEGVIIYDMAVLMKALLLFPEENKDLIERMFNALEQHKDSNTSNADFVYGAGDENHSVIPIGQGFYWKTLNIKGGVVKDQYQPITGENAWLANAYVSAAQAYKGSELGNRMYRRSAELAKAVLALQAENGGIRMAPDDVKSHYSYMGTDFYQTLSFENNVSAYSFLKNLHDSTDDKELKGKLADALVKLENFLFSMYDGQAGYFLSGVNLTDNTVNRKFATDCQTWIISVFGAERFNEIMKERFGIDNASVELLLRTLELSGVEENGQYIGLDFTERAEYVSFEWTLGWMLAVKEAVAYSPAPAAAAEAETSPQLQEQVAENSWSIKVNRNTTYSGSNWKTAVFIKAADNLESGRSVAGGDSVRIYFDNTSPFNKNNDLRLLVRIVFEGGKTVYLSNRDDVIASKAGTLKMDIKDGYFEFIIPEGEGGIISEFVVDCGETSSQYTEERQLNPDNSGDPRFNGLEVTASAAAAQDSTLELPSTSAYLDKRGIKSEKARAEIAAKRERLLTILMSKERFVMMHYTRKERALIGEYLDATRVVSDENKEIITELLRNIEISEDAAGSIKAFNMAVSKMEDVSDRDKSVIFDIAVDTAKRGYLNSQSGYFLESFYGRKVAGEMRDADIPPYLHELINEFKRQSKRPGIIKAGSNEEVLNILTGTYETRMQGITNIKAQTRKGFIIGIIGGIIGTAVLFLLAAVTDRAINLEWFHYDYALPAIFRSFIFNHTFLWGGILTVITAVASIATAFKYNFEAHVLHNVKNSFAKLDIVSSLLAGRSGTPAVTANVTLITTQDFQKNAAVKQKFGTTAVIGESGLNISVYVRDTNNIYEQKPTGLKTQKGDRIAYRYTKDGGLEFSPSLASGATVREISRALQENPDMLIEHIKIALKEQGLPAPENLELNIVEIQSDKRDARPAKGFGLTDGRYDTVLAEYESDQNAPYFEYNPYGNPKFNLGDTDLGNFDLTEIDDYRTIKEAQGWMFAQRYLVFLDKINNAAEFEAYLRNNVIGKATNGNIIINAELAAELFSANKLGAVLSMLRNDGISVMTEDGAAENITSLFDGIFYREEGIIRSALDSSYEKQKAVKLDNGETFEQDIEKAKGNVVIYESAYEQAYKNSRDGFMKYAASLWTTAAGIIRISLGEPITPETSAETARNFNIEKVLKAFPGITVDEVKELSVDFYSGERLYSVLRNSRFGVNNMAGRYLQEIERSLDEPQQRIEAMKGFAEGMFEKLLVAAELNKNGKTKGFNNKKIERFFGETLAYRYGLKRYSPDANIDIDEIMRDLNSAKQGDYYEKMLQIASKKANAYPLVAEAMSEMIILYGYTPDIDSQDMTPSLSDSRIYSKILSAA
ncbi:MAG: hypothetical protein LBR69_08055 [Endomicrobium sp.]|jgi:uncharacterized integral membrane protein|nr:hypothetical protein [Endomicrobium sp.]